MANLEVGDIVLCTVERIEKTIVFVKIEDENKDLEGSIIMSEVAPGRIRNIRNYVVPKKKIVCKVLRISGNRIDLSFFFIGMSLINLVTRFFILVSCSSGVSTSIPPTSTTLPTESPSFKGYISLGLSQSPHSNRKTSSASILLRLCLE